MKITRIVTELPEKYQVIVAVCSISGAMVGLQQFFEYGLWRTSPMSIIVQPAAIGLMFFAVILPIAWALFLLELAGFQVIERRPLHERHQKQ